MVSKSPHLKTPAGAIVGWRDSAVVRASDIRYARARRFSEPAVALLMQVTTLTPACSQATDSLMD